MKLMPRLLLIIVIVLITSTMYAQFAGGSGTQSDPWQVSNATHLNNVRNYLSSSNSNKCFIQIDDIDLGVAPWNQGEGWVPIGTNTSSAMFQGTYNGNGYVISNLYINRSNSDYQGLFGCTQFSTIINLGITNVNVTGRHFVGGLVGYTEYGDHVSNSYCIGNVCGTNNYVGGLVGIVRYSFFTNCFSKGSVSGSQYIGGLIGKLDQQSQISNSYSTSSVDGVAYVGGLIGHINWLLIISNCYSIGRVINAGGGLIGYNADGTSTVSNCYWNTQTSGKSSSAGGTGKTTYQMTYPHDTNTYFGWDFCNIWIPDVDYSVNYGYPYHRGQVSSEPYSAVSSVPADLAFSILPTVVLSWDVSFNESYTNPPTGFKLWLGTDNPPTNVINGIDLGFQLNYDPTPDLVINTTYYWKVVPYNALGEADNCDLWSFVTYNPNSIDFLYPNGGEQWMSGTTKTIRWANNSPPQVKLYISYSTEAVWNLITTTDGTVGYYHYQVPVIDASNCLLKLSSSTDETLFDICDNTFSISNSTTQPKVVITYPNSSGIYLSVGQSVNLTWTRQSVGLVALDLSSNDGISWTEIATNINSNTYTWIVPDNASSKSRIRVRSVQNLDVCDISDNVFSISKVQLLSPNGGETVTSDYSGAHNYRITWSAPGVTNIKIEFSANGGTSWTTVISSTPAVNGSYIWRVAGNPTITGKIKISNVSNTSVNDISDANFTICNSIRILNANGGGFVTNLSNFNIRWLNQNINPSLSVFWEYSTNNSSWTRINQSAIPLSNQYMQWFVNTGLQSTLWLRAVQSNNNLILTKSESAIQVTEKQLRILTPAISDTLGVDEYTNITWLVVGCSNLIIEYTVNFGNTWLQIAANIPSTQTSYIWHVPNTPSSSCRIRLRDMTYTYMQVESEGEFSIAPYDFIASFHAINTSGYANLVVQFYDDSIGYVSSWAWDFNDDDVIDSEEQNPVWIYRQSGLYTVTLTISDSITSSSFTRINYIYVIPMVTDFAASVTSGFSPLQVHFTDLTPSTVTQWQWDFDNDGFVDSNAQNPYWTYIFPGIYTVKLHVTNGYDSDVEIKTNYITTSLNPAITHYVPTDYLTIQAAINASNDGDYIIVADGTYFENLVIEGKNITLASYYFVDGDSTHIANTIIDGSNALNPDQASTLTILPSSGRPTTKPHIVGFTIRNGIGRRIVQNIGGNTIEKRVGGGVYIRQSDPMFTANKIEDNDADDEGGGSYAFQSLPNFGGVVNAAVGVVNPGNNQFYNNHADIGADIYIYGVTTRDAVKVENCGFEVFSAADTTLSNYWANSSVPLSFVGCSGVAAALTSDIYVSTNGSDTQNTGLTPDSPFKTIDYALSRAFGTADNPITIHIASGTYSPSLTGEKFPLQMVKYVSLQGAGQEETFLDAEANADYPGRVLNLDRVEGVTISGLSLMGGFVTLAKNYNGGGIGVIESSASLHHALIANCSSAGDGAGIYAYDSTLNADSLNVAYNSALGSGGGFASVQSELTLANSIIEENSVNKNGAGISADAGLLSIQGCTITNNQATGYQSKGGGLAISNTVSALIRNNRIKHNKADNGAGLYLQGNSELSLDRNQIRNNLADFNGGGLFVNTTTGLITNNLISGNTASQRGGGLYCYSSPQIINNTIACNKANLQGGGLYLNGAAPSISNSILWANQSGSTPNQLYLFGETADPNISYCDVQDGQGGIVTSPESSYSGTWENNLDAEPQFVELPLGAGYYYDSGDFDLQEGSPCIDTGDPNTGIALFPLDLDGNARIDNNRIDIGAYEHIFYYGPRITANPQQISFGRLNINGVQQSLGLSLTNTGNQPLQIHSLTWENNPSVFAYEFAGINQDILPGNRVSITLSFLPPSIGSYSNNLIINNNSLNQAALMIPVSGIGIDASTSTPGSLSLNVVGDDVQLSWNAVTSDPNGDPYTPDGYIVLYSENADVITDNYFYLDFTEATTYTHNRVAHYRNKMFYRVIAVKDIDRFALVILSASRRQEEPLTWAEVRTKFFGRKHSYGITKE